MKPTQGKKQPTRRAIYYDITPEFVRGIEKQADCGRFQTLGRLVDAIRVSTPVQSALQLRLGALKAMQVSTDHPDEQLGEALVGYRGDYWQMLPEEALTAGLSLAWIAGWALIENEWIFRPEKGRWVPLSHVWALEDQRYDPKADVWYVKTTEGEVPVDLTSDKWWLLTPYGKERPWRNGKWRGIAESYLLGAYGVTDLGGFSEMHGAGVRVRKVPNGTKREVKEEILTDMEELTSTRSIVLEASDDLSLLESKSNAYMVFRFELEYFATEASVAILSFNLLQRVEGGSFAAARVHQELFNAGITSGDGEDLSTALHDGSLKWWTFYNYSAKDVPYLRFTRPRDLEAERKARLERDELLARTLQALAVAGITVDKQAYLKLNAPDLAVKGVQ